MRISDAGSNLFPFLAEWDGDYSSLEGRVKMAGSPSSGTLNDNEDPHRLSLLGEQQINSVSKQY